MTRNAHDDPSFSLGNRLGRLLWGVVRIGCFSWTPLPLHAWRSWVLRGFGARLGRNCHIYPGAVIWAPWNLVCEDEATVADGVIIYNQAPITLGDRKSVV